MPSNPLRRPLCAVADSGSGVFVSVDAQVATLAGGNDVAGFGAGRLTVAEVGNRQVNRTPGEPGALPVPLCAAQGPCWSAVFVALASALAHLTRSLVDDVP